MKQADYKTPFLAFLLQWLAAHDLLKWMSDKMYIKLIYRFSMGEKLNLENPQTFNEKLQWLKLYDRNPLYTDLVDKYRVREFVKDRTGGGST